MKSRGSVPDAGEGFVLRSGSERKGDFKYLIFGLCKIDLLCDLSQSLFDFSYFVF